MKGWSFSAGVKYDADNGVLLVSEADPVVQTVNVSPGGHYLNTVRARCAEEPTPGRVQINWLDIKGRIVNTDIKIFGCSPIWTEHTMEVTAPSNAEYAVVFVTGHTKIPLEFKSNSLRQ